MNKPIEKSIEIGATAARVWDVLTLDKYTRLWYAEFNPGAHAVTDWQQGSKALFMDDKGSGIAGMVEISRMHEKIALVYHGMIFEGREDYESADALAVKGMQETYTLHEHNGHTQLDIYSDMDEAYFDSMSEAWDRALNRLKELAETP